jgi:predicted dehydrogenase
MSQQPIRIGVIGCGRVMQRQYMHYQVPGLKERGLAEVVAMCDVDATKRDLMREKFGVERFTTDYQEIAEADDIDLVLVLTSGNTHFEPAYAALKAGKHVMTEKPMAVSLEDGKALRDLALQGPGQLLSTPATILSPTFVTIWRRVQNGDIGRLLSGRAFYSYVGTEWSPWFFSKNSGSLFDLGVYNLVSITGLFGPAKRVSAFMGTANPEYVIKGQTIKMESDDNTHVMLDFGGAAYAVITTGYTAQKYRCPGIELYGSEGTLQMLGDDWAPKGYEMWQNKVGAWQLFEEKGWYWHWTDGLRHFVESLHRGVKPLITPEHAYHVLEIMLKARQSSDEGVVKDLESTFPMPDLHAEVV